MKKKYRVLKNGMNEYILQVYITAGSYWDTLRDWQFASLEEAQEAINSIELRAKEAKLRLKTEVVFETEIEL